MTRKIVIAFTIAAAWVVMTFIDGSVERSVQLVAHHQAQSIHSPH
jgi:hypothetical protein